MIYLEELVALRKGYMAQQKGFYDTSDGYMGRQEGVYDLYVGGICRTSGATVVHRIRDQEVGGSSPSSATYSGVSGRISLPPDRTLD